MYSYNFSANIVQRKQNDVALEISVLDVPAGPSNEYLDPNDDQCVLTSEDVENADFCEG